MLRVAADRLTKCLLHSSVVAGRRPAAHHRAERARERHLGFHIVQVRGEPIDAINRVNMDREGR